MPFLRTHPARASYQVSCPGEIDFEEALANLVGDKAARQVLREAIASVGATSPVRDVGTLRHVAKALTRRSDVASVVGHSMLIRLKSYNVYDRSR